MILPSLVSYYEALEKKGIMRPGWSIARVSFAVRLRPDGSTFGIVDLRRSVERGKNTVLTPKELYVPSQVVRSSGIRANFMCDTAAYLLGVSPGDKKAARKFEAARELHLNILNGVTSDAAETLRRFFTTYTPGTAIDHMTDAVIDVLERGANITFSDEDGNYLMEDLAVASAWEAHYANDDADVHGRCLVTGREDSIAVLHDKIRGVEGAQSVGASLVGFNAPAFESYGKDGGQGLNAPVGRYAMAAYTSALNYLISGENCTRIGDTTVVWWTLDADDDCDDFFRDLLCGSDEETLSAVMRHVSRGEPLDISAATLSKPFCILGLAPNAARLSVRFSWRDTFGTFVRSIAAHYERLEIEKSAQARRYLTPYRMLLETVPSRLWKEPSRATGEVSPLLGGALLSAILNNRRYPETLYASVLVRVRAEHEVTPGKAAIIKAYLIKNTNCESFKEVLTVALNEESTNRAYVLGRLFAALETAQYHANNSSNLKERFMTSACATPALVFPTMLQTASHHLAKSGSVADSRLIATLMDKLDGGAPFPTRLGNTEQGLFLLGYYHQTQKKFRDIEQAKSKEAQS